jgi:hypothetical protein
MTQRGTSSTGATRWLLVLVLGPTVACYEAPKWDLMPRSGSVLLESAPDEDGGTPDASTLAVPVQVVESEAEGEGGGEGNGEDEGAGEASAAAPDAGRRPAEKLARWDPDEELAAAWAHAAVGDRAVVLVSITSGRRRGDATAFAVSARVSLEVVAVSEGTAWLKLTFAGAGTPLRLPIPPLLLPMALVAAKGEGMGLSDLPDFARPDEELRLGKRSFVVVKRTVKTGDAKAGTRLTWIRARHPRDAYLAGGLLRVERESTGAIGSTRDSFAVERIETGKGGTGKVPRSLPFLLARESFARTLHENAGDTFVEHETYRAAAGAIWRTVHRLVPPAEGDEGREPTTIDGRVFVDRDGPGPSERITLDALLLRLLSEAVRRERVRGAVPHAAQARRAGRIAAVAVTRTDAHNTELHRIIYAANPFDPALRAAPLEARFRALEDLHEIRADGRVFSRSLRRLVDWSR